MRRTCNCGVGFVVVVDRNDASRATAQLRSAGLAPFTLGEIVEGAQNVRYVVSSRS